MAYDVGWMPGSIADRVAYGDTLVCGKCVKWEPRMGSAVGNRRIT